MLTETFRGVPASLSFVGVPRVFIHSYGTPEELDTELGLDVAGLRGRITSAYEHSA